MAKSFGRVYVSSKKQGVEGNGLVIQSQTNGITLLFVILKPLFLVNFIYFSFFLSHTCHQPFFCFAKKNVGQEVFHKNKKLLKASYVA